MDKAGITERVKEIAGKAATESGADLVHVEIAGTKRDAVVRVFIDKEGGVTLDDCSRVSRAMELVLDEEDVIPSRYVLEISSPGIERELYSLGDFEKFSGQLIKLKLKEAVEGQKTFVGALLNVDGSKITVDDRMRGPVTFEYSDVDKANLKIDLSKEFKGR
jgi:ribosome maturation factor RimP